MTRKKVVVIAIILIILGILIPVCISSKGLFKKEVHEYAQTSSRSTVEASGEKTREHELPKENLKTKEDEEKKQETAKSTDKKE